MGTFVTGDCHGRFNKLFIFAEKMQLSLNDSIIILGDMGLYWRNDKKDFNSFMEKWQNFKYKCNLYWIDGNQGEI